MCARLLFCWEPRWERLHRLHTGCSSRLPCLRVFIRCCLIPGTCVCTCPLAWLFSTLKGCCISCCCLFPCRGEAPRMCFQTSVLLLPLFPCFKKLLLRAFLSGSQLCAYPHIKPRAGELGCPFSYIILDQPHLLSWHILNQVAVDSNHIVPQERCCLVRYLSWNEGELLRGSPATLLQYVRCQLRASESLYPRVKEV